MSRSRLITVLAACLVPLCVAAVPVRQSYDVSDLLGHPKVVAPSATPASGEPEQPDSNTEDRATLITAAVRAALPPQVREKAQVSVEKDRLWVTADPAGQAIVKRVIDTAADLLIKPVMIEARVVRLSDASLQRLGDALRARLAAARIAQIRPAELTAAETDELLNALRRDPDAKQLLAPRLTMIDGQPATLEVSDPTLVLTVGARASLSADGAYASVDIDFFERRTPPATRPSSQRLSGLYTAKTGATVLITPPQADQPKDGPHTLMLVRVGPAVPHVAPATAPAGSP